jgi:hypothetical protein
MRLFKWGGGLILFATLHASCSVDEGPPTGSQGGGSASSGGKGTNNAGRDSSGKAGRAGTGVGGSPDQAGAPAYGGSPDQAGAPAYGGSPASDGGSTHDTGGVGGAIDDEQLGFGGLGEGGSAERCADVRPGDSCGWDDPCVFQRAVCVCEAYAVDRDGNDYMHWSCIPRGCPAELPGPDRCITTAPGISTLTCDYGARSCECEAWAGEPNRWSCPMVCPTSRPAEHEPCKRNDFGPSDPEDSCTYGSTTCTCTSINDSIVDAEWRCTN